MKNLITLLLALHVAWSAPQDGPPIKEAQTRFLRGNYGEALGLFDSLAKDPPHFVAGTLGVCRALEAQGEYDKAQEVIESALQKSPASAALHAHRAELMYLRGRWEDADAAVASALENDKNDYLAHWIEAQLARDRGDNKKATAGLLWFVTAFEKAGGELGDPEKGLLTALAELERARGDKRLIDQFEVILNDVLAPLAKKHKDFWPAEYHAGRLLLEKYNYATASRSLDRALAVNPRAVEVLVAKGESALQRYDIADADQFARRALEINPHSTPALRLLADAQMVSADYGQVMQTLEKASAVNPREEPTLARIAACHFLAGNEAAFQQVTKQALAQNPKAGIYYEELAERLDERKRYPDAEKYYKLALKLRPVLVAARNQLGLLYMRLGLEEDARNVLEEANKIDPYNVRVVNTLKVLDHLEAYDTLKTEHFLIRFDAKSDAVLARVMGKYLEKMYTELADLFQYRPEGPILIEVFNRHEMFSGRVMALPDLHTIGACTGRMFAMVSPRDKSGVIAKPFNWARVLRHELVHIFNLEQTGFKVPHWYTEGLAVSQEGLPMPPMWHQLLRQRLASGELLNLDTVNLGFIRPTSPEEWQLAYLQSYQYVEYLKKLYGKGAVGDLLKAFGDGLSTDEALVRYFKTSKAEFEKGYRTHLEGLVKQSAGKLPEKPMTFKEVESAHAKEPGNPEITARLAERYLLLGDRERAKKLAAEAIAGKANQPLASYVQARLLEPTDRQGAIKILEAAVDPSAPDLKVLKFLASMRFEAKEYDAAARILEMGRKADAHENSWLIDLAKIYKATNNNDKLLAVLIDLAPTAGDDLETRKLLAELLSKAGRHAEAERFAREALEIDVLDTAAQRILDTALKSQNKTAEAAEWAKIFRN
jgi:cellulose synthase operon protein C